MKEVVIDGKKFFLRNPLTEDEIKAIKDGSRVYGRYILDLLQGREPDRELLHKHPILRTKMVLAAVSKGYEIPSEDLRKMKAGDVFMLFDRMVELSKDMKR